ncbi:MAG: hypothetical protein QOF60_321 [Actinomycetota bacterium]|jgi:hypothetical protein|nr:hypothetical protein [Actinomycetota bacterium]
MTVTETTLPADAAEYLAEIAARLGHLPAETREEVLSDIRAHLAELAAEPGPGMQERLGPPGRYAAELLASAGLDVVAEESPARGPWWGWRPPAELVASFRQAAGTSWWFLRAALAAAALLIVLDVNNGNLPGVGDLHGLIVGCLLAASFAVPSVWFGLEARAGGSARWPSRAATAVGAVALFVVVQALLNQYVPGGYGYGYDAPPTPAGVLTHADGRPVENIFAFDRDGKPVSVFLYDQDGRPLDDVAAVEVYGASPDSYRSTRVPTDANGTPLLNLYPRTITNGRGQTAPPPAVMTPRLAPPAEPSSSTTPPTTMP